jgi:CCR4-NOT transcription complex subunit 2
LVIQVDKVNHHSGDINTFKNQASLTTPSKSPTLESPHGTSPTKINAHDSKEKFGLRGLIDVIRMTNPDLSMLSLGCDLATLGLDLNSNENVYSNFMTPFSDSPSLGSEPSFPISPVYASIKVPSPLAKIRFFSDETLFYIFYSMPRDVLQEAAAQELYQRNWRFHKEFKLWLTKDSTDSEPIAKGSDFERGLYVFFDPSSWTRVKKEWILYFDQLEERNLESNASNSWASQNGSIFSSTDKSSSKAGKKPAKKT